MLYISGIVLILLNIFTHGELSYGIFDFALVNLLLTKYRVNTCIWTQLHIGWVSVYTSWVPGFNIGTDHTKCTDWVSW